MGRGEGVIEELWKEKNKFIYHRKREELIGFTINAYQEVVPANLPKTLAGLIYIYKN